MDEYSNKYQNLLEKYPDNDDNLWIDIDDKFEEVICKSMGIDQAITVYSAIKCFMETILENHILL